MIVALGLTLSAYVVVLALADIYLITFHLRYAKDCLAREHVALAIPSTAPEPLICVQLPVHNEAGLVGQAIDSLCGLDWPKDCLEILILDDHSTDDTARIAQERVNHWSRAGLNVSLYRRTDRREYKAGLLKEGFERTSAAYIAIFDVDHWPTSGFLRAVMKVLLADPNLAFVQARLDHRNRNRNWLTRAQATELDMLLAYEHATRNWAGIPVTFNGTCAVWRRAAINDAGGWSGRSLTEDQDLSFRAFARSWRCRFLVSISVPGELPETFAALSTQRSRWTVGTVEQFRLPPWNVHKRLSWSQSLLFFLLSQFHATVRFAVSVLVMLVVVAWLWMPERGILLSCMLVVAIDVIFCTKTIGAVLAMKILGRKFAANSALDLFYMWAIQVLLLPSATFASLKGLSPHRKEFVRTPKKGPE
jgi:cellulose synthase/poly-beta-1,6-N-acetylglucosamine synthase-like glycosyltransferase